jgi:eukaryotic-like serine/threonine-protein kinase
MSEPRDPDPVTVDVLPQAVAAVRSRFAAAWHEALTGSTPPRLADYLTGIQEPDRTLLVRVLQQLDEDFRSGGTIDRLPSWANGALDPSAGTIDAPRPDSGTVDAPSAAPADGNDGTAAYAPVQAVAGSSTLDQRPAAGDSTLDFADNTPSSPSQELQDSISSLRTPTGTVQELPTVGGYQIVGLLGRGAMGVVYKAKQRGLQRLVALKMILAGGHASEHDIARFRVEAQAVAQLQHPNIVQVYEVGEQDGNPFFSLEFVDGGSLNKRIRGEPQPIRPAAHLTMLLADGMEVAHQKGVVHRDLKPANVMLTTPRPPGSSAGSSVTISPSEALYGIPKIADFGLAKRLEEESGTTRSGTILGTPSYMAPEQAEGKIKEVGPLADVYALGAILYELLTGRPPFRGDGMWETLNLVRTTEPVPPTQLNPKVPRDLETICLKCLQKEQSRRYPSASALAEDLRHFLAGEPIQARPVSAVERTWRWCRRNPVVAGLITLFVVALVAGTAVSTYFAIESSARANQLAEEKVETEKQRDAAYKNEARAVKNAGSANQVLMQGQQAIKDILKEVTKKLGDTPDMRDEIRDLRKQILEQGAGALEKFDAYAKDNLDLVNSDPNLAQFGRANALIELGGFYIKTNNPQKALEKYEMAQTILAEVVHKDPANQKAQGNLSLAYLLLGDAHADLGHSAKVSEGYYQKALEIRQGFLKTGYLNEPLKAELMVAEAHNRMGLAAVRQGDPSRARTQFEAALALYLLRDAKFKTPASASTLAQSYQVLGDIGWRLRDERMTMDYFDKALAIRVGLVQKIGNSVQLRWLLALAYAGFGDANIRLGKASAAATAYGQALDILHELAAKDSDAQLKWQLGSVASRYGTALALSGKSGDAQQAFHEALLAQQELGKNDTAKSPPRWDLARAFACTGQIDKALELADRYLASDAANPERLRQYAFIYALCAASQPEGSALRQSYVKRCLDALTKGTAENYFDVVALETDPDLIILRPEPAFQQLLARLKTS